MILAVFLNKITVYLFFLFFFVLFKAVTFCLTLTNVISLAASLENMCLVIGRKVSQGGKAVISGSWTLWISKVCFKPGFKQDKDVDRTSKGNGSLPYFIIFLFWCSKVMCFFVFSGCYRFEMILAYFPHLTRVPFAPGNWLPGEGSMQAGAAFAACVRCSAFFLSPLFHHFR